LGAIVAASPCSDAVNFHAVRWSEMRSVLFGAHSCEQNLVYGLPEPRSHARSQWCWFWRSVDDLRVR
jgi:hypothetical protein